MHVALIADTDWLDDDLLVFNHLVVGLTDELGQVVQVVPQRLAQEEPRLLGAEVTWRDSSWGWVRCWRLARLVDHLDDLKVDLIHALSSPVWIGAIRLAKKLQVPAVFGLTSAGDLRRLRWLQRLGTGLQVAIVAATEPLAVAAQKRLAADWPVITIRPGVHTPPTASSASQVETSHLCAVVSGTGARDEDYRALLTAIGRVTRAYPQTQFFFDTGHDNDQHSLWQAVRDEGLLANVSMLSHELGRREMLLQGHVVIHPQALGRCRSVTLEAMARTIPVLARGDPWLDYLIDDQTAWLVPEPDPQWWVTLIKRVIEEPSRTRSLAQRGRAWVKQRHLTSSYVDGMLALYQRLHGQSIKFPTTTL